MSDRISKEEINQAVKGRKNMQEELTREHMSNYIKNDMTQEQIDNAKTVRALTNDLLELIASIDPEHQHYEFGQCQVKLEEFFMWALKGIAK